MITFYGEELVWSSLKQAYMQNTMWHLENVNITTFKAACEDNDNVVLIACGHFNQVFTMHNILAQYQEKS